MKNFFNTLAVWHLGLILLILAVISGMFGYINQHGLQLNTSQLIADYYTNISTELVSIAITILVVDALAQRRADQAAKAQLIREIRNPDNGIVLRALQELEARGWTADGSLRKAYLLNANFENAFLRNADLSETWMRNINLQSSYMQNTSLLGATLVGANLRGVRELTAGQLIEAKMLLGATMPNGERYDGRFNLSEDITVGRDRGYNMDDPILAAEFYSVPVEIYLQGQEAKISGAIETDTSIHLQDDWLSAYTGMKRLS